MILDSWVRGINSPEQVVETPENIWRAKAQNHRRANPVHYHLTFTVKIFVFLNWKQKKCPFWNDEVNNSANTPATAFYFSRSVFASTNSPPWLAETPQEQQPINAMTTMQQEAGSVILRFCCEWRDLRLNCSQFLVNCSMSLSELIRQPALQVLVCSVVTVENAAVSCISSEH